MIEISLTDFVDIVSTSGTPKATKVAQVKRRPDYHPATDFYRPLREGIAEIHRSRNTPRHLDFLMSSISDPKKTSNYPAAVSGYKRWWGRKSLTWFEPPKKRYTQNGVSLIVNPELGLEFGGQHHVVKLYFKKDHLTKLKMDLINEVMAAALSGKVRPAVLFSVLDVRNSKLFSVLDSDPAKLAIVDAELAYIAAIWPKL